MVEHYPNYQDFNDLVELINNSENDFDLQLVQKAYLLARSAHKNSILLYSCYGNYTVNTT